jgi:cyclophilin family peptidyl-prolyl cis-trans isomerase
MFPLLNGYVHPIGKHTIFGRVSSGIMIVNRIGLVPTDSKDRYVPPINEPQRMEHAIFWSPAASPYIT